MACGVGVSGGEGGGLEWKVGPVNFTSAVYASVAVCIVGGCDLTHNHKFLHIGDETSDYTKVNFLLLNNTDATPILVVLLLYHGIERCPQ